MRLNDKGVKVNLKKPATKSALKEVVVPEDFVKHSIKIEKRKMHSINFSYSHKKVYVEWIKQAKREETAASRMETAIEWLSEGKSRNWKYER